jgi:transposase
MGSWWSIREAFAGIGRGCQRAWQAGSNRMFHRWQLCDRKKGGRGVGKTKRGKGTKLMAMADGAGLPIAISIGSATPHEVRLVDETLKARFIKERPERLIGDRAYDSDPLDERLKKQGVQMIAPHKANRKKASTQDGRPLRRYRKRWKIERLFAWLQNFRRIQVRHDRILENYLGFVLLGCMIIFLRSCF